MAANVLKEVGCFLPSMLAQRPTAKSFDPLRRMAPKRCPREKGSIPGGTFWKALSGQLEKNRAMALFVLALGLEKEAAGTDMFLSES